MITAIDTHCSTIATSRCVHWSIVLRSRAVNEASAKPALNTIRDRGISHFTLGIRAMGFGSIFMDISSELIHSLLPVFITAESRRRRHCAVLPRVCPIFWRFLALSRLNDRNLNQTAPKLRHAHCP